MMDKLQRLSHEAAPIRYLFKKLAAKVPFIPYSVKAGFEALDRPHYGYCVLQAASLARKLGLRRISVLEFGVAGGNGLINLEWHARQVGQLLGVQIDVYGFDSGKGLPGPIDYRDLPYHWKAAFFEMDVERLQAKLTSAKLVLGPIEETAATFFEKHSPAPIGAMAFDVDYYSSTMDCLKLLDGGPEHFLPRAFCYFDDTVGTNVELYSEYTGMRLAINEFNATHDRAKLDHAYLLTCRSLISPWYHQIRILHLFDHPDYCTFISSDNQQLPLNG
jgi:hypothetical protein